MRTRTLLKQIIHKHTHTHKTDAIVETYTEVEAEGRRWRRKMNGHTRERKEENKIKGKQYGGRCEAGNIIVMIK